MRKAVVVSVVLFFCLCTSSYAFNFGSLSEGVKAIGNSVDGAAGDVLKATGDVLAKEQAKEEEAERQAKLKAEAEKRKAEQERRVAEQKERGVEEAKKAPVGHAKAEKTTPKQEKREVAQEEKTVKKITLTSKERSVIDRLLNTHRSIVELGIISGYSASNREISDYKAYKGWYEESSAKLKRLNPELLVSHFEVRGKDFAQVLEEIQTIIAQNDKNLEVIPTDMAQNYMNSAFFSARAGERGLRESTYKGESFCQLTEMYNSYIRDKELAIKEDKRVLKYYADTIKHYDTNFVPAYKAEKQKVDAQLEARRLAEAKRREEEYKREERERLERQRAMENRAAELGFDDGYIEGIRNLIGKLTYGELSSSDAEELLIFKKNVDYFKVQSLDGDYVYYVYDDGHFNYTHIGIVREDDQYYGQGALLNAEYFHFIGFVDAVTVLGARKQIPIFETVTGDN